MVKAHLKKVIYIIHRDSGCPTPLDKVMACENEKQFKIDWSRSSAIGRPREGKDPVRIDPSRSCGVGSGFARSFANPDPHGVRRQAQRDAAFNWKRGCHATQRRCRRQALPAQSKTSNDCRCLHQTPPLPKRGPFLIL